ncbi:MAG: hypothetical protein NVS9B1_01820 [Candidatus Dormibacteraceae bacterium]
MAKRGRPAVLITTTVFAGLGTAVAAANGVPELPMLIVPHPLGVRPLAELRAFADEKADEFAARLAAGQPPPP